MDIRKAEAALKASPDLQALVAGLLARIESLEAQATAKGRGGTVKDAIAATIEADLQKRRATRVTKTAADGELHDHFLDLKIRKRAADREAELQREADRGISELTERLRRKAEGK